MDKNKAAGIGCLSIIVLIIIFVIYAYASYKPSELERVFKLNDLGTIDNLIESDWNSGGKIIDFNARKIKYKAFINPDGSIYQIFVGKGKTFPIYNENTQDFEIDNTEKEIIKNMSKFLNKDISSVNGSIKYLDESIKSMLHYPNSYQFEKAILIDQGKNYIIIINFKAKNALGKIINGVAKFKIDFKNNNYSLIESID